MTKELMLSDLIFDVVNFDDAEFINAGIYTYQKINSPAQSEYSRQKYTFKYGNYDTLDLIYSLIVKSKNYYK